MSVKQILDRVQHRITKKSQWVAVCPAHSDRSPSLHIKEKDDGRVLIHCKAGCGANDILAAIGLDFSALFPDTDQQFGAWRPREEKGVVDDFVIEIFEANVKLGKSMSKEDKDRYRKALINGGKNNGFVDQLIDGTNTK